MKYFFLLLISISIFCCSDDESSDESNDITAEIVGEYSGTFTSDIDNIDPFSVTVTRVDDDTIEIAPTTGNDFLAVTVDIQQTSDATIITQADQPFDVTASFALGDPTILTFGIDPTGFMAQFNGTKQ